MAGKAVPERVRRHSLGNLSLANCHPNLLPQMLLITVIAAVTPLLWNQIKLLCRKQPLPLKLLRLSLRTPLP